VGGEWLAQLREKGKEGPLHRKQEKGICREWKKMLKERRFFAWRGAIRPPKKSRTEGGEKKPSPRGK